MHKSVPRWLARSKPKCGYCVWRLRLEEATAEVSGIKRCFLATYETSAGYGGKRFIDSFQSEPEFPIFVLLLRRLLSFPRLSLSRRPSVRVMTVLDAKRRNKW